MMKAHIVKVTRTLEFCYMDTNLSTGEAVKEAIREAEYWTGDHADYSAENCEFDTGWKEVKEC